jgi:methionyl-tRNA synthetase
VLAIQLDEQAVETMFLEELKKRLNQLENRHTLWDMKELCRQTCMSEYSIKEKLFVDERFPKFRSGGKWYFPARECERFLLQWVREQPNY